MTEANPEKQIEFLSNKIKDLEEQIEKSISYSTERNKLISDFNKSEERYKKLSMLAMEGILLHTKGIAEDASLSFAKMFGYEIEELIGKNLIDLLIPKEYHQLIAKKMKDVHAIPYIVEGIKKDGSLFPVEIEGRGISTLNENNAQRVAIFRDITERNLREKKLRESEENYQNIVETTNELIQNVGPDGKILFVNKAWLKTLEYTAAEVQTLKITDILREDQVPKITKLLQNVTKDQRINGLKTIFITKSGKEIYVEGNGKVIFDNNTFVATQGFFRDITEKEIAEKKLIESEEKYRLLSENAQDWVYWTNPEGHWLYCSPSSTKLSGYEASEFIKNPNRFLDIIYPDDIDLFKNHLKSESASKKENYLEFRIIKKSGDIIWISHSCAPIFDTSGKYLGRRGTNHDISQRKRAEKENTMLAQALKSINECVSITDMENKILFVNRAFLDTYGYNEHELIGKHISLIRSTNNPQDVINQILPATIKGEWRGELLNKRKDGSEFPIELSTTVIKDQKDKPIELIGIATDITERKRTEQKLIDALEKATESDRLKSAFLATMSHELRTPLNAIIGFSDFLDKDCTTEDAIKFGEIIKSSGNHLLGIVEDLLDITLIESGIYSINKENITLRSFLNIIYSIIKIDQQKINKENLQLKLELPANCENLVIYSDATKLKQIFINLLKNALKFTNEGSIVFGYLIDKKNALIKFFVKDTGIGIKKEDQEIIFDMFRQVDDSHTRIHDGVGIGLSISKKLTEFLGGEINVNSDVGKGTEFYFTIPLENEEINKDSFETLNKEHANPIVSSVEKTLLIVEDEESNFEFLKFVLEKSGYKNIWAKNGQEAIDLCRTNTDIALVLMDLRMPIMNGIDATKEIKRLKPDLPIIAQTAFAMKGDRDKALDAGCDDYISKPINKNKLMEIIANYI